MKIEAHVKSDHVQKPDHKKSETLDLLNSTQLIIKEAVQKLGYNVKVYE